MEEPQQQLTLALETLPRVLMFSQSFLEPLGGGGCGDGSDAQRAAPGCDPARARSARPAGSTSPGQDQRGSTIHTRRALPVVSATGW